MLGESPKVQGSGVTFGHRKSAGKRPAGEEDILRK